MKIQLLILSFLSVLVTAHAQKENWIKGKWQYKEVADASKLDSQTLKEAKILFRTLEMEFLSDGKYRYGQTIVGTWALNKEKDKVIVSSNGKTSELLIKALSENELRLNMGKAVIIMMRPPKQLATNTQIQNKPAEVDTLYAEVYKIFNKLQTDHRNKVKALLQQLQASMVMNDNGDFLRRSSWPFYSKEIKEDYCKAVDDDILNYRQQLEKLGLAKGKNELRDRLLSYLDAAKNFSSSCRAWANTIASIDADNNSLEKVLTALEKNSGKMKNEDNAISDFIDVYKKRNFLH